MIEKLEKVITHQTDTEGKIWSQSAFMEDVKPISDKVNEIIEVINDWNKQAENLSEVKELPKEQ